MSLDDGLCNFVNSTFSTQSPTDSFLFPRCCLLMFDDYFNKAVCFLFS